MSTYDPNRGYDPNRAYEPADSAGYGIWAVLGIIALFVVVGFIYWGAAGSGPTETARAPATHTETTGMGGGAPARPSVPAPATTPATPAR